jgi:predicted RNase H-like nuclease
MNTFIGVDLGWIQSEAGSGSAVAAVDAPLVIRNQAGIRFAVRGSKEAGNSTAFGG